MCARAKPDSEIAPSRGPDLMEDRCWLSACRLHQICSCQLGSCYMGLKGSSVAVRAGKVHLNSAIGTPGAAVPAASVRSALAVHLKPPAPTSRGVEVHLSRTSCTLPVRTCCASDALQLPNALSIRVRCECYSTPSASDQLCVLAAAHT